MKTVAAAEAKSDFDRLLASVADEEVVIVENDRPVAAMLTYEAYRRIKDILAAAEDAVWSEKARAAEKEGFLGADDGERMLRELLNARD